MGKILVLLLGLSVMGYLAWRTLAPKGGDDPNALSQPAQRLENAREAARRIEQQQQDSANRADVPQD